MFIELNYPIGPKTTILEEGLKEPQVTVRSRIAEGRSSNTSYIELFAHTGTHIDAPWHFNPDGKDILAFDVGDFVFSHVLLVDIPKGPMQPITREELTGCEEALSGVDALLIRTGFNAYRVNDPAVYVHQTPGLSVEAAEYLTGFTGLRCIGVDFISIENVDNARTTGFPVHHALLDRAAPMILLEDANFTVLGDQPIKRLYLFPLRMEGLEASPVTSVAEV